MDNKDFVVRLRKTFEGESMADVARRLKIPHATVRNYYLGRLPAPEVLMKIANETGVSLNWLLIGAG
ncbi:MAG TPA: helix-turn-helix domain-containing protein, partial [Pyrinomonadaceae bacterium]|nr:helix-turn-helix domain-containing protein [Pyrinomonadaceae bacterium]